MKCEQPRRLTRIFRVRDAWLFRRLPALHALQMHFDRRNGEK
jgi:hypothetical protein